MKLFLFFTLMVLFTSNGFSQGYTKLKEADKALCNKDTTLSIQVLEFCLSDSLYMNDLGQIYYSLGKLYRDQGNYNKSISDLKKGLNYRGKPIFQELSCFTLPTYTSKIIREESALIIGQNYININQLDSAEGYFHLALTKYKTRFGCVNALQHQYSKTNLALIDLYLIKQDTIKAKNKLLDLLLIHTYYSNEVVNTLQKLLLKTYSQKYITDHVLNAIENMNPIENQNLYAILLFGHRVKYSKRNTLEETKKQLLKHPSIRKFIGKPSNISNKKIIHN